MPSFVALLFVFKHWLESVRADLMAWGATRGKWARFAVDPIAMAVALIIIVIAIFITVLLAGALLPSAFSQVFNANTAGWTLATVNLFQLIPLFGSLTVFLAMVFLVLVVVMKA